MITKPNPLPADPVEGVADIGMETAEADAAPLNAAQREALREALEDLAELDEYAAELGLPPASPVARDAAQAFLQEVIRKAPRCYAISPWEKGSVAVYTMGAKGSCAGIYFSAKGSASCHIIRSKGKGDKEYHYPRADQVANEKIFSALRHLEG